MGSKVRPKRYFSMHVDEDKKVADIYVYGDIVVPEWQWYESDTSGFSLAKEVEALEDVDTINVFINSYGGHLSEGLAIYNSLRRHGAEIVTYCDGYACSAASLVFMAGDERIMSNASVLLVHSASSIALGTAKDLRKEADDLETVSKAAMNAYLNHVSITAEEMETLMDEDRYMKADEALEKGFATKISQEEVAEVATMSVRRDFAARLTKAPQTAVVANIEVGKKEMESAIEQALEELRWERLAEGITKPAEDVAEPVNKPLELLKGFFGIKNKEE